MQFTAAGIMIAIGSHTCMGIHLAHLVSTHSVTGSNFHNSSISVAHAVYAVVGVQTPYLKKYILTFIIKSSSHLEK